MDKLTIIDVEFQKDGKVVFRDPNSNNEVLNEGTWSQKGDEIVMATKRRKPSWI